MERTVRELIFKLTTDLGYYNRSNHLIDKRCLEKVSFEQGLSRYGTVNALKHLDWDCATALILLGYRFKPTQVSLANNVRKH